MVEPDGMKDRGEDESVPPVSTRSEMDEIKGMLAVVIAQEQSTTAKAQDQREMLKTGLLAVAKELRQAAPEQCESLRE